LPLSFDVDEQVEKRLPLQMALQQTNNGVPIWFPPSDRDLCLCEILSSCALTEEKAASLMKKDCWRELRRDYLASLQVNTLQSMGLSLVESLDFVEKAKWLRIQEQMRFELLQEEKVRAAQIMHQGVSRGPETAEEFAKCSAKTKRV
jgi:hypothetical protein